MLPTNALKCFGKSDGMPIPTGAMLYWPMGKAVSGLEGRRRLSIGVTGVSEVYPIEALKSNAGGLV